MNELNKNNVSETVRRLNPRLFGGMDQVSKPKSGCNASGKRKAMESHKTKKGGSKSVERRPTVTITSFRQRELTDATESLAPAQKYLRDAIAKSLELDDADEFIEWKYYQTKVEKRSEEGTFVKIEI